ncbi:MAG: aminoacyl-tRNA hydrolase [Candidatus Kaiserbacteria bacterium]|nr:aminoacyl-tRNA hydrolase [Candidatus Kaiserbacteria bacterium]
MEFLLVGLGNPDPYIGTPHNIGKDFVMALVRHEKQRWSTIGGGKVSSVLVGSHLVACAVSDGYMNETGTGLADVLSHADPSRVLVVHDETDVPLGSAKVSYSRSSGGHKGVLSVEQTLGTKGFFRIRVGIGKHDNLAEYVLQQMSEETKTAIASALRQSFPEAIAKMVEHHRIPFSPQEISSRHTDLSERV